MNVTESMVSKITVSGIPHRDAINIIFEDYRPGCGKATIEVFGDCWSYCWGGMGDRKMESFFLSCGEEYLVDKFAGLMDSTQEARSGVQAAIRSSIIEQRKQTNISKASARDMWDAVKDVPDDASSDVLGHGSFPISELWGDEWWYHLPKEPNPKYEYLREVVRNARAGIKQLRSESGTTQGGVK